MTDILRALTSLQNNVHDDGGWRDLGSRIVKENSISTGYTEWFLSKDHLQVGDTVRSRKPANSCNHENMDVPEGKVVGLERDGFVLVRVHGIHDPLRVHVSTLERVTNGLAAGDWIRLKEEDKKHSPVGILHSINRDGSVAVGFVGVETLWKGNSSQFQMAESYCVGQFVKLRANVLIPQFQWPHKTGGAWATGRISQILPNGCLVIKFPGRLTLGKESSSFLADPAEVEVVTFNSCRGIVMKYQHLEDFHWTVRPLLIALGLFTAMKLGLFAGKKIRRSRPKKLQSSSTVQSEGQHVDVQTAGNSGWFHPTVANLFRDGVSSSSGR